MSSDQSLGNAGSDSLKDAGLNRIASAGVNVAQFVSFGPDLRQRFAWISEASPNRIFSSIEDACGAILSQSEAHKLNIRSFKPGATKGNRLLEGIPSAGEAAS